MKKLIVISFIIGIIIAVALIRVFIWERSHVSFHEEENGASLVIIEDIINR